MSGNLLACFILTSGPVTLSSWPGVAVRKNLFYIYVAFQRHIDESLVTRSQGAANGSCLLLAGALFIRMFSSAPLGSLQAAVRRRCMNIQCGGKKEERKLFQVLCEWCWRSTKQLPSLFFICHSHRTKLFSAAYCPSFALCSCAGRRGDSSASECECSAPWLGPGWKGQDLTFSGWRQRPEEKGATGGLQGKETWRYDWQRAVMTLGKYHIVLPETKKVLLTVAWGSMTEAAVVLDMIGSHSFWTRRQLEIFSYQSVFEDTNKCYLSGVMNFKGSVSRHVTVCKPIEVSEKCSDLHCWHTYNIHSSLHKLSCGFDTETYLC